MLSSDVTRAGQMSGPPSPEDRKKAPVSGVMPVHNEMDVLQEVLDSVARQTRPVDELIIVFDRCTDGSREVALRLPHEEITVDLGNTGAAVRVGLERARYSTVVLFDGNTRVPPDYVEGLLKGYAATNADILEWHGGLMLLPNRTIERFGPPTDRALWTLEFFLRVEARGGKVVHLKGPFLRLKPSPLHRNFRYGIDYAELSWQYALPPFFRVGTKSGLVQDIVAIAGTLAGHMRSHRLIDAIAGLIRELRLRDVDET